MTLISLNFKQSSYATETGAYPIALISFGTTRVSGDPTGRLSSFDNDVVYGTVSRGNPFVFLPMEIVLPDETEAGPGNMTLQIDNIHRSLTETIRLATNPIPALIEIVMSNALDTVDITFPEYMITSIQYDASTITATLTLDDLTREAFPGAIATPATVPGLFA